MDDVRVGSAALAGGLRLPYAETGDPDGRAVVLVHAYVESWRYFEAVLRLLPRSLHAFAPTQRGHGAADKPAEGYRPADMAADIIGFMDAVGIDRAALVGASSGALVSQIVASTHPERVSALVLISSPASLGDKPAVTEMWERVRTLEDPLERVFVEDFVRSTSPVSVPDELVAVLVEESLRVPARVWTAMLRGLIETDVRGSLSSITAPTLLIAGDHDAFVRADQSVLLHGIAGARLSIHEHVGHGVHLSEPGRVVDEIVAFLDARGRRPGAGA